MDTALGILFLVVLGVMVGLYVRFWFRTLSDIKNSDLDSSAKGMWTLAIIVFQLVGPFAWWYAGPGNRQRA